MFSPIRPWPSTSAGRETAVVPTPRTVRPTRRGPSLDEAYELRLLGEVARWDDQAAFEQLYAAHHAAVIAAAAEICGDREIAADAAQQAFIALWARAGRIVAMGIRLRPWLLTVARNAALDARNAASRRAGAEARPVLDVPSAERTAIARATRAELDAALAALPALLRDAVELVHLDGIPVAGAAVLCGVSIATLNARLTAAAARLRAAIGEPA